jgi:tetratricopeptide (TPR) repeat protein
MYKARINAWNLHKNLKKAQKATLFRKVRQGGGVEKLLPNGRPLMPRLMRYYRENKVELRAIEAATSTNRRRRANSLLDAVSHADAAAFKVQSLFRPPYQPSWPIVMYGDIRTAEAIKWYTETYLDSYLRTGPGTLYYQVVPVKAAPKKCTAQSLVWTRNESAWSSVVCIGTLTNHVVDAIQALKWGFTESAFEAIDEAHDLLPLLFRQQTPSLLSGLIDILATQVGGDSSFAQKLRQFILDMAATVLGTAHPLTMITKMLCTVSSTADQLRVWRAVTDSYDRFFGVVEDFESSGKIRWNYYLGLWHEGLILEAQDYLEVIDTADGVLREQDTVYLTEKAECLREQGRYVEADFQYGRCLELLKEAEDDILAHGRNSTFLPERIEIDNCLHGLARVLAVTGKIDEAKAMYWRTFEFVCAAFGADGVDAQIAGADLDDFLIAYEYLEESASLRAQHPRILLRNELPPECL